MNFLPGCTTCDLSLQKPSNQCRTSRISTWSILSSVFFFIFWTTYGRVSKLGITQKKTSLERVHCKTTTKGLFFRRLNLEDRNIGKPSKNYRILGLWKRPKEIRKLHGLRHAAVQLPAIHACKKPRRRSPGLRRVRFRQKARFAAGFVAAPWQEKDLGPLYFFNKKNCRTQLFIFHFRKHPFQKTTTYTPNWLKINKPPEFTGNSSSTYNYPPRKQGGSLKKCEPPVHNRLPWAMVSMVTIEDRTLDLLLDLEADHVVGHHHHDLCLRSDHKHRKSWWLEMDGTYESPLWTWKCYFQSSMFWGSMLVNFPGCSGLMVWGDPWPIQLRVWCVSDLCNCIVLLRVLKSGDCYQLRSVVHPRLSHYLQGGCTYQIMQGFFHHQ